MVEADFTRARLSWVISMSIEDINDGGFFDDIDFDEGPN